MEQPMVSIIMGTYNPQISYFSMAIDSLINQSFKLWELLLIDDGSDDKHFSEIQAISQKDPRIICIRESVNHGLAYALNKGMRLARGKYIARMDDDDVSYPRRLRDEIDFLEHNSEYDWVGCEADLFDENGIWGKASRPENPSARSFLHSSPFIHPSVMFRKDVLLASGGYKEDRWSVRCEDYGLFMRLYAEGHKGYNLQSILFQYRDDPSALRRSMRYCYYEMRMRLQGFSEMGILSLTTFPYVFKPILVGIAAIFPGIAQRIRINRKTGDHKIGTDDRL